MKIKNIIGLALGLSFSSGLAHANLVEDGSQFNGVFHAQDAACVTPAGIDLAGQPFPERTDFNFEGAIDSLTDGTSVSSDSHLSFSTHRLAPTFFARAQPFYRQAGLAEFKMTAWI